VGFFHVLTITHSKRDATDIFDLFHLSLLIAWCITKCHAEKKQKQLKESLAFRNACDKVRNANEQHNRSNGTSQRLVHLAHHVGGQPHLPEGEQIR